MGDFVYRWDAYWYGFSQFKVLLFFASLICLFILFLIIAFFSKKRASVISFRLAAGFLVLAFAMPFTSRFKEEVAFRKACDEEAGLHIFKPIELSSVYWFEIDPDFGPVNENTSYILNQRGVELNFELFSERYVFVYQDISTEFLPGYSRSIRSVSDGSIVVEARYFTGGPSGVISQRTRFCQDLKENDNKHFPRTDGQILDQLYLLNI